MIVEAVCRLCFSYIAFSFIESKFDSITQDSGVKSVVIIHIHGSFLLLLRPYNPLFKRLSTTFRKNCWHEYNVERPRQ
jgi:hypothetical protein